MTVTAYCYSDESGINSEDAWCLVVGCLYTPRQKERIERDWNRVLTRWGVEDFHSKDFFSREARRVTPKFAYDAWPDAKAHKFLARLLAVIAKCDLVCIGGAVDNAAFAAMTMGERRWLTGGRLSAKGNWKTSGKPSKSFYVPLHRMLTEACHYVDADTVIHFVFDQQKDLMPWARDKIKDLRAKGTSGHEKKLGDIIDAIRTQSGLVQIADLFTHAWWAHRTYGEHLDAERQAVMEVIAKKDTRIATHDAAALKGELDLRCSPEHRAIISRR